MGDETTTSERYEAAMVAFRSASRAHSKAQAAHLGCQIDDETFLAAKKALDAAGQDVDAAEAALLQVGSENRSLACQSSAHANCRRTPAFGNPQCPCKCHKKEQS